MVAQSGTLSFQRKVAGDVPTDSGSSRSEQAQAELEEGPGHTRSGSKVSGKAHAELENRIKILETALAQSLAENSKLKQLQHVNQSNDQHTVGKTDSKISCTECNVMLNNYEALKSHMASMHFTFIQLLRMWERFQPKD